MMGDMIRDNRGDWELVREMVAADSRIDPVHTNNSHKGGRGAGGHCLIKDFAVMRGMYARNDFIGSEVLSSMEKRNVKYLLDTEKDVKLVEGVYSDKEFLAGISELYAQKKEKNDDGREQA